MDSTFNKRSALKVSTLSLALGLASTAATAAEIRFDGFASFVGGQVLDKEELFNPILGQYESYLGFDEKFNFQENTLYAIQVRADLLEKLSATAQITAKGSDGYDAKFNWAYVTYNATDEISIKVGRSRIPYFMYSDYLDVGYAYHWISPPDTVYNLSGFDSADGISMDYVKDLGNWVSRLSVMVGNSDTTLTQGGTEADTQVQNIWVVAWNMNYGSFNVRLVHAESELTIDVDGINDLAAGLSGFGVTQDAIDNMLIESDRGEFDGIGISYDPGNFFVVAEYTELGFDGSSIPKKDERWYVSGGLRFGVWTTYATVEGNDADPAAEYRDAITDQLDTLAPVVPTLPPAQQAAYAAVYGGTVANFNNSGADQSTYSLGVRYDFHPSASLKFEYSEEDDKLRNTKPQAIAAAIDLVF